MKSAATPPQPRADLRVLAKKLLAVQPPAPTYPIRKLAHRPYSKSVSADALKSPMIPWSTARDGEHKTCARLGLCFRRCANSHPRIVTTRMILRMGHCRVGSGPGPRRI